VADDFYSGISSSGTVADASNGFETPAFEPGVLTITFIAEDGCNNATKADAVYTIVDCMKPTPYCEDGIRVQLMPSTGEVVVWASDLNLGSFDNCDGCAGSDDPTFSFSADPTDNSRTFTCSSLGMQNVEIWVTDPAGNQDLCKTFVIVQDNMNACNDGNADGMVAVTGRVANSNGEMIEQVIVSVNGGSENMPAPAFTDAAGTKLKTLI